MDQGKTEAKNNFMKMKRIVFRIEGNNKIGMGHTFTTLRIADKIKEKCELLFVMSNISNIGIDMIKSKKYEVKETDADNIEEQIWIIKNFKPDVVFNDLLHADAGYMKLLKKNKIFTINMEHSKETETRSMADVVINSLYPDNNSMTEYHYGPEYSILSDSFKNLPKRYVSKECKKIFVCFGGSDISCLTLKVIKALSMSNLKADVVVVQNPNLERELKKIKIDRENIILHRGLKDLSGLMLNADIGIVSGGYTCYESAATGLPVIILSQNELEHDRNKLFIKYRTGIYLGKGADISDDEIIKAVNSLINDFKLRKEISEKGQKLVDGKGLDRVVDIIMNH
ncbi:hypothetical protein J4214_02600 [Candidatus Woesearchaeota archaeon]|nr:hypothetical protein [Candidatus Woesearchaeota archaeon]